MIEIRELVIEARIGAESVTPAKPEPWRDEQWVEAITERVLRRLREELGQMGGGGR